MTAPPLKDRITDDMKAAMRAREADRLGAIRMLLAAIKQKEVDERIVADDAQVAVIVDKLIKQRRDSIAAREQAGRTDLADKEKAEVAVLAAYLPAQASLCQLGPRLSSKFSDRRSREPLDDRLQ